MQYKIISCHFEQFRYIVLHYTLKHRKNRWQCIELIPLYIYKFCKKGSLYIESQRIMILWKFTGYTYRRILNLSNQSSTFKEYFPFRYWFANFCQFLAKKLLWHQFQMFLFATSAVAKISSKFFPWLPPLERRRLHLFNCRRLARSALLLLNTTIATLPFSLNISGLFDIIFYLVSRKTLYWNVLLWKLNIFRPQKYTI